MSSWASTLHPFDAEEVESGVTGVKNLLARRTRKSVRPDCADIGVVATQQHADMAMRKAKNRPQF